MVRKNTLLSGGFILPQKAERMQREEAGIPLAAIGHPLIHPRNADLHIPKNGVVLRTMKYLTPDAFYRRAKQIRLGIEIIVDRAYRHPAACCDRADADGGPALPPDQLAAGFQYFLFGCYGRIHAITSK